MKPYNSGYLSVSKDHTIYFEQIGNPKKVPVIFLHGGPGGQISSSMKEIVDFKNCNALFYDQRGCGKSQPPGLLKENNTQALVDDLKLLMDYLGLKKACLVGSSWGSTLALCFAIQFPKSVIAMTLGGIFLADKASQSFFLEDTKNAFPEAWDVFQKNIPTSHRRNPMGYLVKKLFSRSTKEQLHYTKIWINFESALASLYPIKADFPKDAVGKNQLITMAQTEVFYMNQNFFLPDGYILKHTKKIKHIPTQIIHGRYDFVCPAYGAYELHKKLPNSTLTMAISGHSRKDSEMENAFTKALKKMILENRAKDD